MEENSTRTKADGTGLSSGGAWFDPIEAGIRDRVHAFIEELLEQGLMAVLGRTRHQPTDGQLTSYRNWTRERQLSSSFGLAEISVSHARMAADGDGTREWRHASHNLAKLPFDL